MKASKSRFIVLGGLCAAAALAYFTRNGVGPAESTIRSDLHLTMAESGAMMSAFFWPYALCQLPAAMLSQRFGARRMLALYAVLWSLATAGMALGDVRMMTAARACMGVAQAGLVPLGIMVMARWFPRAQQASVSGAFSGFMSAGSIIGAPLTAWLVFRCGWRPMFLIYAVPGLVWAAWFVWWFRDDPARHRAVNEAERDWIKAHAPDTLGTASRPPWLEMLANPAVWFLCLQQFCRAAGYIFFGSWFATYLQEARGVTIVGSGWLTSLPVLADALGCMAGGMLSDAVLHRTGSERIARQGLSVVSLAACAALITAAWFVQSPLLAVLVISAGMFCAAMVNPCFGATVVRQGGPHAATLAAIGNMCGNFGAAAFPLAVPWLVNHAGGWNAVLAGFGALYVIGAACWIPIRDRQSG